MVHGVSRTHLAGLRCSISQLPPLQNLFYKVTFHKQPLDVFFGWEAVVWTYKVASDNDEDNDNNTDNGIRRSRGQGGIAVQSAPHTHLAGFPWGLSHTLHNLALISRSTP